MKEIMQNPIIIVLVYIIVSFIGIILHDFKYLFFLNSNNKIKAVIICGTYCVFNTTTTLFIAKQPLVVSLPVVCITNMISMWIAMSYSEKNLKETIYDYEITTKFLRTRFELKDAFKAKNIPYEYSNYWYENDKGDDQSENIEKNQFGESLYHKYIIHSYSKRHSNQLEEILNKYDKKYLKWKKDNTEHIIDNS